MTEGSARAGQSEQADRGDRAQRARAGAPRFVVGIGASTGALAALRTLCATLPAALDAALVIVVHLAPEHESRVAPLLQPHCALPVREVTQTVALEAGRVYVIAPNANLDAIDTHLRLSPLERRRGERAQIDHFLGTLAAAHGERAIAVILTGAGSDGTLGVRRIRMRGGYAISQDPREAECAAMPASAIATGMVDFVLPLRDIPAALGRLLHAVEPVPEAADELSGIEARMLDRIAQSVHAHTGQDLRLHERGRVLRQVRRRMRLCEAAALDDYLEVLRQRPGESGLLARDVVMTAVDFFEDSAMVARLEGSIIPRLIAGRPAGDPVRVWSLGCSTGEVAYTFAMLYLEAAGTTRRAPGCRVFATEFSEDALLYAREGLYPVEIATAVSPARLRLLQPTGDLDYAVIERRLSERAAPPALLIDARGEVVRYGAGAGRYVRLPGGAPALDVFELLRAPLGDLLRRLLRVVERTGRPALSERVTMDLEDGQVALYLRVIPDDAGWPTGCTLVAFIEVSAGEQVAPVGAETARDAIAAARRMLGEAGADPGAAASPRTDHGAGLTAGGDASRRAPAAAWFTQWRKRLGRELAVADDALSALEQRYQARLHRLAGERIELRALLEASGIATVFLDSSLRLLHFTSSAAELFDLSADHRGRPFADLPLRLRYPELQREARRAFDEGGPLEHEVALGERRYLCRMQAFRRAGRAIGGMVCLFIDITALRSAQADLRVSEERLRLAARAAGFGTYDVDPVAGVVYWSAETRAILGIGADTPLRPTVMARDVIHPDDRARIVDAVYEALDPGGDGQFEEEYRVVLPDGAVRWVLVKGNTQFAGMGFARRAVRATGVVLDISRRRSSEEQVRELAAELEQRVARRTTELIDANHRLHERTEQLGRLAAELARVESREHRRIAQLLHDDVQQLLYGASLHANLIATQSAEDAQDTALRIAALVDRAVQMVRTLTAELSPLVLHDVGLTGGLEWLADWMEQNHRLQVMVRVPVDPGPVPESVAALVFQCVRELLFNVVRHAGVSVASVTVERPDEAGLQVRVGDTGRGFDADAALAGAGTGFGLFSVRERLARIGGRLVVTSAAGSGTSALLEVPLALREGVVRGERPAQ